MNSLTDEQRDATDAMHREAIRTTAHFLIFRLGIPVDRAHRLAFHQINLGREILNLPQLEWPPR